MPSSNFDYAGPFNEMIVMGVLAVRLQGLERILKWDGPSMQFTNINDNDTFRIMTKDGFHLKEGHPYFDNEMTDSINTKAFVAELIRHTYRDGWSLPGMPV